MLYGGGFGGNADRVLGTWEWDGAVWSRLDLPVRVPKTQKIWIVLRHGLL